MKSSLESGSGLVRKLSIEVPAADVQKAYDSALKSIQRKVEIKGFRKGKAPLKTVSSLYGQDARNDVLNSLVSRAYEKSVKEHTLDPISSPSLEFKNFEPDQDFKFSLEFEIRPEVSFKKIEGLKIEKEDTSVNSEDVDKVIENLRERNADHVTIFEDRALATGDFADINFEGFVNGTAFEGGKAENFLLEIGSGQFIPGFEEGLLGMKPGDERDVSVQFPEDYQAEELKGQPAVFKTKLNAIKKRELPAVDDQFAAKLEEGLKLADLRSRIEKDLAESKEKQVKDAMKNKALRALFEANPVDIPQSLAGEQKKALLEDVRQKMEKDGLGETEFQEYCKKWDKDFDETSQFMVGSSFLIDALAEKLEIKVGESDVEEKLVEYAKQTGIEVERIREFYQGKDSLGRLAYQIMEERVVDHLIDKAEIK